ncbi:MAG: tetratricopeptide repeat protein [Acidobacteriia bacterium]|nr:tetratricopeptide repeat protein [Terriglobia bacterium]
MSFGLRTTVAAICLLIFLPGSGLSYPSAQAEIQWLRSLSAALGQASSEHKMIIAEMVADWCPWCKIMEKETWAQPAVIALSGRYVFLKLDIEKDGDGIALAKKFRVSGLPTVMLMTSSGEEFTRLEEYYPAQEFIDKLKAVLADPESLGNLRTALIRDQENIELRFKLGYGLFSRSNYTEAEGHFAQIIQRDPQNKSKKTDASMFYLAVCKADRSDVEGSLAALDRLRKDFPDSNVVPGSFILAGQVLLRAGKRPEAREQVQAFLKKYPGHPLTARANELLAQIGNQ